MPRSLLRGCSLNERISNWKEWGELFQSIPAFTPLVEHILRLEKLPLAKVENLTPGTNAVFKTGNYVVKVFAPAESGVDQTLDLQTELFAAEMAGRIGVSAPRLIAKGVVEDRYLFAYMISEYVDGVEFTYAVKTMNDTKKLGIGRKLREITDKMNKSCEPFNGIDVINDKDRHKRWDKYSDNFKAERLEYIRSHDFGEKVFVHGDLCGDNILISRQDELYIIDFADAVHAPILYEHALVAVELFEFDSALLRGYFGEYSIDKLTEVCLDGMLIHDFGGDIVNNRVGNADEFHGLSDLRERLWMKIKAEYERNSGL